LPQIWATSGGFVDDGKGSVVSGLCGGERRAEWQVVAEGGERVVAGVRRGVVAGVRKGVVAGVRRGVVAGVRRGVVVGVRRGVVAGMEGWGAPVGW